MRALVDTNVFVSGVFWKGPPHEILLRWARGEFSLVVSPPILEEYSRVLSEISKKFPLVSHQQILNMIELHGEIVSPARFSQPVCHDPDDDKFLEAALASSTTNIVTGDKALLALNGFRELTILKPNAFLQKIKRP